jgi:hypothetical protein
MQYGFDIVIAVYVLGVPLIVALGRAFFHKST